MFVKDTATTEICALSLHEALPIAVPIGWVDVEAVASDAESSDTDTVVTH